MNDDKLAPVEPLRYTNDGALAECPCCASLDVGGAHDTVHCQSCGLTVTKPRPLQNAIDAWNTRAGRTHSAAPDVQGEPLISLSAYEALQAECERLRKDTARLDFMLAKWRKVIVECLPQGRYEVYVEEGVMGDRKYPVIPFKGTSEDARALQREAIDAAMEELTKKANQVSDSPALESGDVDAANIRPIHLGEAEVLTILAGQATTVRKVIEHDTEVFELNSVSDLTETGVRFNANDDQRAFQHHIPCPYGKVGDMLWGQESWATDSQVDAIEAGELSPGEPILYPADGAMQQQGCTMIALGKVRQAADMPRWASRIAGLQIVSINAEREHINGQGHGMPIPWVWVIELAPTKAEQE